MRRIFISFVSAAALLFCAVGDRAQQPTPPQEPPAQESAPQRQDQGRITQTVSLVDVLFTVLNRRNKLVPDLEKDDFKLWKDKIPQAIRYFSRQTDLPLRIGLLMDPSNSIRDRLK